MAALLAAAGIAPGTTPPAPPQQQGGGFIDALKQSLPFILATIAHIKGGPVASGALLQSYNESLANQRALTAHSAELTAQHNQKLADFVREIGTEAPKFDDPTSFASFLASADNTAQKVWGTQPGFIAQQLSGTFDNTLAAKKDSAAAQTQLAQLKTQYGDQFDTLVQSGATVPFKGNPTTLTDLMATAGVLATNPDGTTTAPSSTAGLPTSEPAFIANAIKAKQKELGRPLTETEAGQVALQARSDFAEAARPKNWKIDNTTVLSSDGVTPVWTDDKGNIYGPDKQPLQAGQYQRFEAKPNMPPPFSVLVNGTPTLVDRDPTTGKLTSLDGTDVTGSAKPIPTAAQISITNSQTPYVITPGSREERAAQDLADGTLTLANLKTLYPYTRDGSNQVKLAAIYDEARQKNPNFSPEAYERGYKFSTSKPVLQQIASINNAVAGVPDLLKFSDQAERSGLPLINQFTFPGGIKLGSSTYPNFAAAQKAFADELSGALGFGNATDMKLQLGLDLTDPKLSPSTFKSVIQDVVIPFVQRKKAALLGPMGPYGSEVGGGPTTLTGNKPAAPIDPAKVPAAQRVAGQTTAMIGGVLRTWDGTGWVIK